MKHLVRFQYSIRPFLRHRPASGGQLAKGAEPHVGGVALAEGRRGHTGRVHRAGAVREAGKGRK